MRVLRVPAAARAAALLELRRRTRDRPGWKQQAGRVVAERRRYHGDPWAYAADVFGVELTPQQSSVFDELLEVPRLLIPAANNVGKTFDLALWGLYRFDVVASLEGDGEEEQGGRVLLPGPDHPTIEATIYAQMLALAARAERRGHLMPGQRSELSVSWHVRAQWEMEALSPPKKVGQSVAHTASGRHHRNLVALIEEGQGVPEPLWLAAEGMCSAAGNQIASSFNPTESLGPAYERARNGTYRVMHLSAFNHPNVERRAYVIPGAVDYLQVDRRVRGECRDRGPAGNAPLVPEHHDFQYALPPSDIEPEVGPRDDGIPGHPAGPVRVYRPSGAFTGQVLGQWPVGSSSGLFTPGDVDAAMVRGSETEEPGSPPDRVGADVAREGSDDSTAAPAWGEAADALLRAYAAAQTAGPAAVATLVDRSRARIGTIQVLPKGDGVVVARAYAQRFPRSPFVIDETGVGSSPFDHLGRVLHRQVAGVSFAANALPPLDGEPWCENLRTQLYVRAAMLCARGLLDLPDDPLLRAELLAHSLIPVRRTVTRRMKNGGIEKIRVNAVALIEKKLVKKLIGRSPDRAEAVVLALFEPPPKPSAPHRVPASESYVTV